VSFGLKDLVTTRSFAIEGGTAIAQDDAGLEPGTAIAQDDAGLEPGTVIAQDDGARPAHFI
jgi:hypothetical protein